MVEPYSFDVEKFEDDRGKLYAFNKTKFDVKRAFWVYMIAGKQRGEHAQRFSHMIMFCQVGEIIVNVEHRKKSRRFYLRQNGRALYIPPLSWITFRSQTPRALLLCLASHIHDESDYIRDYEDYRNEVRQSGSPL